MDEGPACDDTPPAPPLSDTRDDDNDDVAADDAAVNTSMASLPASEQNTSVNTAHVHHFLKTVSSENVCCLFTINQYVPAVSDTFYQFVCTGNSE